MKKTWIIAAAVVCLAAACNKIEEQNDTNAPEVATITYIKADGNESETKGSVDGSTAAFTWNTGDKIAVWAGSYKISDGLNGSYDGTNAATFAFSGDNVVTEGSRANFAIFPASLVWNGSAIRPGSASAYTASSLKLTLPATYTLEQVQGEVSPTPMIAVNEPNGDLSFKALCPLLRITVENIPKQTKRIEFDFNGKKVQGEFTLTSVVPATTAITTSDTDGTDDIITVTMADNATWHDFLVVNLPVPAGTYGDITISTYEEDGHRLIYKKQPIKQTAAWAPTRKSSRKMTATLPVFTAANGKKVTFAPDNLYATITAVDGSGVPTAADWHFGRPTQSATQSFTVGSKIDLFGWSSNGTYYGINSSTDPALYYGNGTFVDWGNNVIDDYPAETWRTPSIDDWWYFANHPSTFRAGYVATGIVVVPEGFIDPKVNEAVYLDQITGEIVDYDGFQDHSQVWELINSGHLNNEGIYYAESNDYTEEGRTSMKDAGAVFITGNNYSVRTGSTLSYSTSYSPHNWDEYFFHSSSNADHYVPENPEESEEYWCDTFWVTAGDFIPYYYGGASNSNIEFGFYVRLIRDLN